MFDDMFAFIDPIVELNEEGTSFVIQAETFFEFMEKAGIVIPRGADGRRSTRVSDGICYTGKKKKDSQESGNIEGLPEQDSGVKNAGHPGSPLPLPEEAWEKMHHALYEYYFGHIDFLRLLETWEEILGIKKHA